MASLFTSGKFQAMNSGGIVPGAKLFTYAAGSGTATPLATYTDQAGGSSNTNPVVCDANGQASVWLGAAAYHMILKNASDVVIWDVDHITASSNAEAVLYNAATDYSQYSIGYEASTAPSIDSFSGVDPTGAADSAAAINTAIAAASALGITTLRFPGTYKVLSQIVLASNMTYVISGTINLNVSEIGLLIPATGSKITIAGGGTITGTCARAISSVLGSTVTDIRIRDLSISGATLIGAGYTSGIFLDGCSRVWVENNRLSGNGIGASTAQVNSDITFYVGAPGNVDCHVTGNTCRSSSVGFHLACYNFTDSDISGNVVHGALCGSSNNNGYGILAYASGASPQVDRTTITNNKVGQTGGSGIYVVSGTQIIVADNVCTNTAQTQSDVSLAAAGISVTGTAHAVITGNVVFGSVANGISLTGSAGGVISNNRIYGTTKSGIHLRGVVDHTQVSGNTVWACSPNIYNDTSSTGLVISGNTIFQSGTAYSGAQFDSISDSTITGNSFHTNSRYGLYIGAGARNVISHNIALDNGTQTTNTYDGVLSAATQSVISNNRCANSAGSTQKYGITSSGDYCDIHDNSCGGNQTDGLNLSGTAVNKSGNRYSATGTLSGSATLSSGTVTVNNAEIRTGDQVIVWASVAGGTPGILKQSTIVSGTSVVLASSGGSDTSTVQYRIVH